jgi:hypothetical protein
MMAYARLYDSPYLMLLYPQNSELEVGPGIVGRYCVRGGPEQLPTATIDMADRDCVKRRLRRLVTELAPEVIGAVDEAARVDNCQGGPAAGKPHLNAAATRSA